jgi:hypothetical protein
MGVVDLSEQLGGSKQNSRLKKKVGRVGNDIALWKNRVQKQEVANRHTTGAREGRTRRTTGT